MAPHPRYTLTRCLELVSNLTEIVLCFLLGSAGKRFVLDAHRGAQHLHQPSLIAGQTGGYDDMHLRVEVALGATVDARQSLAAQPKNRARLCTFGNPQLLLTVQGRDFDLRT